MGGPMIERLLAAGVEVHLFARRPDVRERFGALGAVVEPSVADLALSAPVLVLCPFSEAQLAEIVSGDHGLLAHARSGTVVVQHATVSVGAITSLGADGAARGVAVVDAPISGRAEAVTAGELTVLVGGDAEALAVTEGVVGCYADTVVHTGGIGSATKVKLINNLLFAAQVQTACSAVELGAHLGVDEAGLLAALTACSADSFALAALRSVGDVATFASHAAPYLRKDVGVIEDVTRALGLDTGVLGRVVRDGPIALADS
jgi:3-hydroxyisobutyrate dehydrogenase-like beta-hydroxyacid dehydrogenase